MEKSNEVTTDMNELVSVVLPIYNSEKYLDKCLKCIVEQTYTNLEIILLNDGSSDESGEICKRYALKDSRIKYIEKENEGQSITRNRGIELSTGKYLYFMDSDDYLNTSFIENALLDLDRHHADCSIFNYYHVYDSGKPYKERNFEEGIYDITSENDRYRFLVNVFLPYKCGFEVWNRIYDANIIRDNKIRFPVFKPVVGEDVCFNFLYILCAKRIHVSNDRYYYYVQNEGSTMALNSNDIQLNRYNEISKIAHEYMENNKSYKYILKEYAYIHVLLAYHELMNYSLQASKGHLQKIVDKDYFCRMIKFSPGCVTKAVRVMGLARGIKYTLFGLYYRSALK
jgi:glycosyltransferase involved in cell wall biosynthesis